jgi:hypothetical protein
VSYFYTKLNHYVFADDVDASFTVTIDGPSDEDPDDLLFGLIDGVLYIDSDGDGDVDLDDDTGDTYCICNLVPGDYEVTETAPDGWADAVLDPEDGIATVEAGVGCDDADVVTVTVTNTLLIPKTTLTITSEVWETELGWNVQLTIKDLNDGEVPLTSPSVELTYDDTTITLNRDSSDYVSGDNNPDNHIMDVDEEWVWVCDITITSTTTFTANGHGLDPLGNDVTYDTGYETERGSVKVEVGGATRTMGFWQTHLYVPPDGTMGFTEYVFNRYTGNPPDDDETTDGYIDLGWKQVNNIEDLMGIFWANNARESDGDKRDKLCQAKEIASQQALAAILNSAMPGGAPLPEGYSLDDIVEILGGSNINDIKTLNTDLTAFNEGGETIALDPSLPPTYRADPENARYVANIPFADC